MLDDETGESLMQRADDTEAALTKRLRSYHEQTVRAGGGGSLQHRNLSPRTSQLLPHGTASDEGVHTVCICARRKPCSRIPVLFAPRCRL